jgi:hypothetical protein
MEEVIMSDKTKAGAAPSNVEQITQTGKKRRTRTPSAAKPAFIIVQLLGDDGQPMNFDKKRVKVVAVERSAEKVMEAMEDGTHQNAFYLRVIVPAGSRAGSPNRKTEPQAAA